MLADAVMWFSSGGTKSVLHNDDGLENINCLFSGTKELLFIDYHKYKHVVPIDFPDGAYSSVDVDRVDFEKYPGLIDVEYYNVTMQAGDCLYIPHRWFHQVRSYGRNIAVNLWWQHEPGFVPKDCDNVAQNQTLNQFNFTSIEDDYVDRTEALLNHLQYYLKRDKLSFRKFVKRLKRDPQLFPEGEDIEWTKELKSTVKSFFRIIDVDKDKYFSSADLDELENSDDETIDALTKEYYQLNDLIEKERQMDHDDDDNDDDNDDDDDDVPGDGDYDIMPVQRSNNKKAPEEL